MNAFRATYTPTRWNKDEKPESRIVLVIAILPADSEHIATAVFIDADNSLKEATIGCFTDCQSTEWRES